MSEAALAAVSLGSRTLAAALVAAAAAYVGNRLTRRLIGKTAIVFVAPGLEESFKTGAALVLGAPVLAAHVAFGVVEAAYDLLAGRRRTRSDRAPSPVHRPSPASTGTPPSTGTRSGRRMGAAAAGLCGHALFGVLTVLIAAALVSWPLGVGAAYLAHVGWNALVVGRAKGEMGTGR